MPKHPANQLAELYPDLSPDELEKVELAFDQYILLLYSTFKKIQKEPDSFAHVIKLTNHDGTLT